MSPSIEYASTHNEPMNQIDRPFGTRSMTISTTPRRSIMNYLFLPTTYDTRSIIIATGAEAVWLGAEGEEDVKGKGVSTCATCDGAFYEGKEVLLLCDSQSQ